MDAFERLWFAGVFAGTFDWDRCGRAVAEGHGWTDAMAHTLASQLARAATSDWLFEATKAGTAGLADVVVGAPPRVVEHTERWCCLRDPAGGPSMVSELRAKLTVLRRPADVWTTEPARLIAAFSKLWLRAVVEPRRAAVPAPAIPHVIIEPLAAVLSGAVRSFRSGNGWALHDLREDEVARVLAPDVDELLEHVSSAAGHALLRYVVAETWRARVLGTAQTAHQRSETDGDRVVVPGGWQALAVSMGRTSASSANRLRLAAMALKRLSIRTPFGFERILSVDETFAGHRRHITLTPIGPLAHGFVGRMKDANKRGRWLVPITEVAHARKPEAKALGLELLLLGEMRTRGRRVLDDEDRAHIVVSLPDSIVAALGQYVDLKGTTLRRLISEFQGPGGFLERAEGDDFRLRSTRQFSEEFLLQGEEQQARGLRVRRGGLRKQASRKARAAASLSVARPDPDED